jgi:hypothetical protein
MEEHIGGFSEFSLPSSKVVFKHRQGRKCKFSGCTTVLSLYNPNRCCFLHQPKIRLLKRDNYIKQFSTNRSRKEKSYA